jgi:hypothetical protein
MELSNRELNVLGGKDRVHENKCRVMVVGMDPVNVQLANNMLSGGCGLVCLGDWTTT